MAILAGYVWVLHPTVLFSAPEITGDYLTEVLLGLQVGTTAAMLAMIVSDLATYAPVGYLFYQ